MEKTLELISLDDDELLDVVGGCGEHSGCCDPCCGPSLCVSFDVCGSLCV